MPTLAMSPTEMLLIGVSTVFESLGRELLCLGPDLRIVHVSEGLDPDLAGRPVKDVLGPELFGEQGPLRRALLAGERREGWSATLDTGRGTPRRLSLSVAPIRHHPRGFCDPRVAYVVMLRPGEPEEPEAAPLARALPLTLPAADEAMERHQIRAALAAHRWRRAETARALGMSRTTLWRRMRELGLAGSEDGSKAGSKYPDPA